MRKQALLKANEMSFLPKSTQNAKVFDRSKATTLKTSDMHGLYFGINFISIPLRAA